MRLIRLVVRDFQCVEEADIRLGPGLNVLYGPNDLGKSALAAACRNVLLLQHSSSAHERFVAWHKDAAPHVELTFRDQGGVFWRVEKTFGFGSRGASLLWQSPDGRSFHVEQKGRGVDEQLRQLLRWGIQTAGGRGGPRGLPSSFLSQVLLAEQTNVPSILALGLSIDGDESGKERLQEALQALAQDPIFKRVLDAAQAKVDEAFTPTGRKRSGKSSPFSQLKEEIARLREEASALRAKKDESAGVSQAIAVLLERSAALAEQQERAAAQLRQAAELVGRARERQVLEAELLAKREHRAKIEEAFEAVAQLERGLKQHEQARDEAGAAHAASLEAHKAAQTKLAEAAERLRRATSQEGVQQRLLCRSELEKRRLELEKSRQDSASRRERAVRVQAHAAKVEALEADRAAKAGAAEAARRAFNEAKGAKESTQATLELAVGLEGLLRWREALDAQQEAQAAADELRVLDAAVAEQRELAARAKASAARLSAPSAAELRAVKAAHEALRVAEARLGGGLTVTVTPLRALSLEIRRDDETAEAHQGEAELDVAADRAVSLHIAGIADIVARAGDAAARQAAGRARKQWQTKGEPVLGRAKVKSIAKLEALFEKAAQHESCAAEAERLVAQLEARRPGLESRAQKLALLGEVVELRRSALDRYDVAALEAKAESFGVISLAQVNQLIEDGKARLGAADQQLAAADRALVQAETRFHQAEEAVPAAAEERDAAARELGGEWQEILAAAEQQREVVAQQLLAMESKLAALEEESSAALSSAEAALAAAEQERERCEAALLSAESKKDAAERALIEATVEHKERKKQAEARDCEGARAAVAALEQALTDLDAPDLETATAAEQAAQKALDEVVAEQKSVEAELHSAQGALRQVGGEVINDRLLRAAEALERAKKREDDLALDCDAWRLLVDTLREAEGAEGAHLGRALAGPVNDRFRELTEGRYGELSLDPDLKAGGLFAAGKLRDFDELSLSAGTGDQLATILRLAIAEQLNSAVILDDHLAQTDPHRAAWFRHVLRRDAQRIQVVVLTCRPLDYLDEPELPSPGVPSRDIAGGLVRAVNLELLVRRATYTPPDTS